MRCVVCVCALARVCELLGSPGESGGPRARAESGFYSFKRLLPTHPSAPLPPKNNTNNQPNSNPPPPQKTKTNKKTRDPKQKTKGAVNVMPRAKRQKRSMAYGAAAVADAKGAPPKQRCVLVVLAAAAVFWVCV